MKQRWPSFPVGNIRLSPAVANTISSNVTIGPGTAFTKKEKQFFEVLNKKIAEHTRKKGGLLLGGRALLGILQYMFLFSPVNFLSKFSQCLVNFLGWRDVFHRIYVFSDRSLPRAFQAAQSLAVALAHWCVKVVA